jgi:hypothetical protein
MVDITEVRALLDSCKVVDLKTEKRYLIIVDRDVMSEEMVYHLAMQLNELRVSYALVRTRSDALQVFQLEPQ